MSKIAKLNEAFYTCKYLTPVLQNHQEMSSMRYDLEESQKLRARWDLMGLLAPVLSLNHYRTDLYIYYLSIL